MSRLPLITNRKLVALVDPESDAYQIDWDRSTLLNGMTPPVFTLDGDDRIFDLSGQIAPLMDILRILMAHGIGMKNLQDIHSYPAARQQVREVVQRTAEQHPSVVVGTEGAPARPLDS